MSSGPDHYSDAERFAKQAEALFDEYVEAHDEDGNTPSVDLIRRQAEHCREMGKLHAALALVAATALNDYPDGAPVDDVKAWRAVASVKPAAGGGS